jgi:hypothetical protein
MPRDPLDFGPTPTRKKGFKLSEQLPTKRDALLTLVRDAGTFPPRASRWLSPQELRYLLRDEFPFTSAGIYAVPEPRRISNKTELLALAADRRVAYNAYLAERRKAKESKPKATKAKPKDGETEDKS